MQTRPTAQESEGVSPRPSLPALTHDPRGGHAHFFELALPVKLVDVSQQGLWSASCSWRMLTSGSTRLAGLSARTLTARACSCFSLELHWETREPASAGERGVRAAAGVTVPGQTWPRSPVPMVDMPGGQGLEGRGTGEGDVWLWGGRGSGPQTEEHSQC